VKPLHSADIPEGSSLTLECHVTGTPSPTISWFRGDQNIDRSPDYILSFVDGVCALRVRKVVKEQHGGEYTCKAANSAGDVATAARVQVITVHKPAFTEFLKDQSAREGTSVTLQCRFTGEPPPTIQWVHNDQPILPSAVFKIIVESDFTSLEIKEVFPEDAGSYAVIAKNLGGESRTSALLTIEGLMMNGAGAARAPGKPLFMTPLSNKEVQEGARALFKCVVSGAPEPEIIWFHNEKPLKETKDFELSFTGDQCSLLIREVYLEDSGEYKCVARNLHGAAQSSCRLTVEPLSELSDAAGGAQPGDVVPPKFTQLLKDIEGTAGELVRFDCRVIGHPTPAIKWYRGRNQIQSSADFKLSSERELHSLTIQELFAEDAGNYMVKASNAAGSARCYASLIIKEGGDKHMVKTRVVEASHSAGRSVPAGHVPPEFTKIFRDMRVRPGESCTMELVVSGYPKPTARWLFNNEPIVSRDYRISQHENTHVLHIPEVFTEDAGRFSLLTENDAGKATCSALLVVVDEAAMLPHRARPPRLLRFSSGVRG
jgi:hypothetical protein